MAAKRVLILCGDELLGSAATTWLRDAGHAVDFAADAAAAAQSMGKREPDLFVTDEVVPRNGAAVSILRVSAEHPRTRIVALCRDPLTEAGLARAMGAVALPADQTCRRGLLDCADG